MRKILLRNFFEVPVLAFTIALLLLSGCGSQKSFLTSKSDEHYGRMLEQQQMKEEAASQDSVTPAKIPLDDPDTFEHIGDIYLKQGNLDMAFIQYGKALRIDPNRLGTRQKVGQLYLRKGLATDALSEFNTILAKDKRNTAALHGKATALIQTNRLGDAELTLREAIVIEDNTWQAYLLLGTVHDRQRRYDDAVAAYRKAIEIHPKSASAYNNLGVSLYLLGQYLESAKSLLSAISLDPSNQRSYNNLGLSLYKLGKYGEALETFKKGGDDAGAYNNMGVLFLHEHKYTEAIEYFEKAIKAKPSYYESAQAGLKKARGGLQQSTRESGSAQ